MSILLDSTRVNDEELKSIRAKRDPALPKQLAGLALSGGGIRSATFSLGVIQALCHHKKLRRFDYLSTVSGGGYIGSWLSALIHRRAENDVAKAEGIIAFEPPPIQARGFAPNLNTSATEDPAVQWLRRYSNYLTPRVGILGVDTWTAIATFTRNLTLNWLVLMPLLIAFILLTAAVLPLANWLHGFGRTTLLVAAVSALLFVAVSIGWGIDQPRVSVVGNAVRSTGFVMLGAGAGTLMTASLGALAIGAPPTAVMATPPWLTTLLTRFTGSAVSDTTAALWHWGIIAALVNTAAWTLAAAIRLLLRKDRDNAAPVTPDFDAGAGMTQKLAEWVAPMLASGALAGVLLKLWSDARLRWKSEWAWSDFASASFDAVVGTPVMLLILSHAVLLFIGLAKRRMSETDREWLGRLGAILFLLGIGWLLIFAMLWLGAVAIPLAYGIYAWLASIGAGAWLLQSLGAIFLGKSALTGGSSSSGSTGGKPKLDSLLSVAPYIFVAGLVAVVGYVMFGALQAYYGPEPVAPPDGPTPRYYGSELRAATGVALSVFERAGVDGLMIWALAAATVCALMSWRVDINLFSYNRFYGNRLARAYLGAARDRVSPPADERQAHPFTDLDPDDDLCLSALATHDPITHLPTGVQRPFHLINTALNLTGSPELAWQSRKSASFTFSPLHCGYAFPVASRRDGIEPVAAVEGYRRSYEYGVMGRSKPLEPNDRVDNLGTTFAMAFPTSGAAASPNMGFHSTPSMALLLTLFNVRLGRWFGNTRDAKASQKRTPSFSLRALLSELLGKANFTQPWLYLSDGGHFENLGIYELVRRRVPLIVVIDAAQDAAFRCVDLANAMRLVRTDFGVEITLTNSLELLRPDESTRLSQRGYVFGKVAYPATESTSASLGRIIYIKPALLKGMPEDVGEYAARGSGFPQETTSDQWFSEAQFESYRRLGEFIGEALCKDAHFEIEMMR